MLLYADVPDNGQQPAIRQLPPRDRTVEYGAVFSLVSHFQIHLCALGEAAKDVRKPGGLFCGKDFRYRQVAQLIGSVAHELDACGIDISKPASGIANKN